MPSPRQDIRGGYCGKQSDRELVFMDIRMVYTNVDGVVGAITRSVLVAAAMVLDPLSLFGRKLEV